MVKYVCLTTVSLRKSGFYNLIQRVNEFQRSLFHGHVLFHLTFQANSQIRFLLSQEQLLSLACSEFTCC